MPAWAEPCQHWITGEVLSQSPGFGGSCSGEHKAIKLLTQNERDEQHSFHSARKVRLGTAVLLQVSSAFVSSQEAPLPSFMSHDEDWKKYFRRGLRFPPRFILRAFPTALKLLAIDMQQTELSKSSRFASWVHNKCITVVTVTGMA